MVKDKRHIDRSICSRRYLINVTIITGQTYFHSNDLEIVQLRLRQKHEDGELTIKQSCDLNYVGRGAELLVRISILANIYCISEPGHTFALFTHINNCKALSALSFDIGSV